MSANGPAHSSGGRIATTKVGHCGRNPSPRMPKMEYAPDTPGGHNLVYCCGRRADFRRTPGFVAGRRGSSALARPIGAPDIFIIRRFCSLSLSTVIDICGLVYQLAHERAATS